MELIYKSAVVKEIDRRIELFINEKNQEGVSQIDKLSLGGRIAILQELKVFLYTLEVKEVDLEVDREAAREKSILDETKVESEWSEKDEEAFHCLQYTVEHYYEDKDIINKCCSWLKSIKQRMKGKLI